MTEYLLLRNEYFRGDPIESLCVLLTRIAIQIPSQDIGYAVVTGIDGGRACAQMEIAGCGIDELRLARDISITGDLIAHGPM